MVEISGLKKIERIIMTDEFSKEQAEEYIRRLMDKIIQEKCPIDDVELYKKVRKHYQQFSDCFLSFLGCMEAEKEITPKEHIEFREMMSKIHSLIY